MLTARCGNNLLARSLRRSPAAAPPPFGEVCIRPDRAHHFLSRSPSLLAALLLAGLAAELACDSPAPSVDASIWFYWLLLRTAYFVSSTQQKYRGSAASVPRGAAQGMQAAVRRESAALVMPAAAFVPSNHFHGRARVGYCLRLCKYNRIEGKGKGNFFSKTEQNKLKKVAMEIDGKWSVIMGFFKRCPTSRTMARRKPRLIVLIILR